MRGINLKEAVKTDGIRHVYKVFKEALGKPKNDPGYVDADDFSIREIWEATVGHVEETLAFAQRGRNGYIDDALFETPLLEAPLDTTGFPTITGLLISSKVLEGYKQPQFIAEQLTNRFPSRRQTERLAGFGEPEVIEEVKEGGEYQESHLGERFITTETKKKGRLISVTEEMVFFDQTGQILRRAFKLGDRAALDKDKTTLRAIMEVSSSYYCYLPSGTAEAIYSAAKYTLYASNELIDYTDIDNVEQYLAEQTDDQGELIIGNPTTILVAKAKEMTARKIVNATEVWYESPEMSRPDDKIGYKGANPVRGNFVVLTSPLVKALQVAAGTASATANKTWWFGDFKAQFNWQEIWPIQTFRRKMTDTDAGFTRDIVAQFKVRHYGGIFSETDKYVVKSTP